MSRVFNCLFFLGLTFMISAQKLDSFDIRCNTVPYTNKLMATFPHLGTIDDFELWMEGEIKKLKDNKVGNRMVTTHTVPIIFHVIHNG